MGFTISFFLGDPPGDPALYEQSGTFLGEVYNFTSKASGGCANCVKQAKERVVCQRAIDITAGLSGRMKTIKKFKQKEDILRSLDPNDVVPFLKKHLTWRIQDVRISESVVYTAYTNPAQEAGRMREPNDIGQLSVVVSDHHVFESNKPDEFPKHGKETRWPKATEGKPGGFKKGDIF
jgi:hypothetical protein